MTPRSTLSSPALFVLTVLAAGSARAGDPAAAGGAGARVVTPAGPDETRHAWRYRREVRLVDAGAGRSRAAGNVPVAGRTRAGEPRAPGVAAASGPAERLTLGRLDLEPEIEGRAQRGLGDLRLLDASGAEVPYALVTARAAAACAGRLSDVRRQEKIASSWTVELDRTCSFDAVSLSIEARDFAKSVRLEASDDGRTWRTLAAAASIFDQDWGSRVHHTTIPLPAPTVARWLRVTLDDRHGEPVDASGVSATSTATAAPARWSRSVELGPPVRDGEARRYPLQLPAPLRPDRLVVDAADAFFAREVTIIAQVEDAGRHHRRSVVGTGTVYRFRVAGTARAGEGRVVELHDVPEGAALELSIADRDDRPLERLRVRVEGPRMSLVFTSASAAPAVLYYGNPQTRAPGYDLATLADELRPDEARRVYVTGPEAENPAFRPMPPLSFVDSRGAPLDVRAYAWTRPVQLDDGDDIYSVFLDPEDLARARPDLTDVRLVDGPGNQVPYVLEPAAGERWLPLDVARARTGGRRGVSRTELVAKGLDDQLKVPVSALSLDVAERFFSRSVFVTTPVPRDDGRRVVHAGVLSRGEGDEGALVVAVPAVRVRELALEIEDGDNAPLTVTAARARVLTPRLAFKWKGDPAGLRLVYGSSRATAPRYDLSTLRAEVLAYAARPAHLGPAVRNPSAGAAAAFGDLSTARTVLWIALVVLVLGLLLVIVRLVKKLAPGERR